MKKFIVLSAVTVMALSVFAMSKTPSEDSACDSAKKACAVKDAASCCTPDGSCKMKEECGSSMKKDGTCGGPCAGSCGCEGKKAGNCEGPCADGAKKAGSCEAPCADDVKKTAEEKAACAGGTCPLTK